MKNMAIKSSQELDFSNKKLTILIYGRPGVGKSTIACSAKKVLVVDIDEGIDRVEPCYRGDTSVVDSSKTAKEKFVEFNNDLTPENLKNYDAIAIDTLGKFQDLAIPVVIDENKTTNAQKDGTTLSMKGYGALFNKFKELNRKLHSLGKHVIWICHSTEQMDGDVVKSRLNLVGSTKDDIWKDVDLGGFVEMQGGRRVIHFTPTERYDAKGSHGISGTYELPKLPTTAEGGKYDDNHFLQDLLDVCIENITNSQKQFNEDKQIYDEAIKIKDVILKANSIEELNKAYDKVKKAKHALTSKLELWDACVSKATELGATHDKESAKFVETPKE